VSSDFILLDPSIHHLIEYIAAINPKGSIIYDCERMKEGTDLMMQLADYLVPSKNFLFDDSLNIKGDSLPDRVIDLSSNIPGQLIVTAGKDGAFFIHESNLYHVLPPKVLIKDTTGAGDNFHGALTLALAQNMEIGDAVMFAVAVASISCENFGSRLGLPEYSKALHIARGLSITRKSI
jgi:sulfofructose kinase